MPYDAGLSQGAKAACHGDDVPLNGGKQQGVVASALRDMERPGNAMALRLPDQGRSRQGGLDAQILLQLFRTQCPGHRLGDLDLAGEGQFRETQEIKVFDKESTQLAGTGGGKTGGKLQGGATGRSTVECHQHAAKAPSFMPICHSVTLPWRRRSGSGRNGAAPWRKPGGGPQRDG